MRVSIATVWCDPSSGTCELERQLDATERAKHTVEKLHARNVQVARCDVEGSIVFVIHDWDHARLDASVRAVVIAGLSRHAEGALVAVVGEADTGRCTVEVIPPSTIAQRTAAAQAAAVVQASWGWDESPEIRVSVGGEVLEIAARYDSVGGWSAAMFDPQ
jgi:hypothetical protein